MLDLTRTQSPPPSVLVFGELLWDCLPTGRVLGGAPANVAYRLNELGRPVCLASRVGSDALGDEALALLKTAGVPTQWIQRDAERPTGTVSVQIGDGGDATYDIHTGVAYDHIEPTSQLLEQARNVRFLCYGTLAQRNPTARAALRTLLDAAQTAQRLVDVNLRPRCFTPELVMDSLSEAHLAKVNVTEAKIVAGWVDITSDNLDTLATALGRRFDLQACVITCGADGGVAFGAEEGVVRWTAKPVSVVDTVGAGDAFTAAFIDARMAGLDLRTACLRGAELGGKVAETAGGMTPVATRRAGIEGKA